MMRKIILLGLGVCLLSLLVFADGHKPKQELTKATDWIHSWETCEGDGAIKTDGTLWQFGKVGGCNWGQITPYDYNEKTGKYEPPKEQCTYYLKPKKIGAGFQGAKIINGGYRVYAIKTDGSLWGWGERLGVKPKKLSHSKKWVDFAVVYAGNGCCSYDIGLQKDGTLWKFHESMHPRRLKQIGKDKWNKIIMQCCEIIGEKRDGSIWIKEFGNKVFVPFTKKACRLYGGTDEKFCSNIKQKFKTFPKNSILNLGSGGSNGSIQPEKKAGTLWNKPKCHY